MAALPLCVANLTKAFRPKFSDRRHNRRGRVVVDDVSFEVAPGEIFGVIGANGSGKSTVIRVISTLLLPDGGDVRVFGHDVVREPLSAQRLINRVSADPSFFRNMSALENLLFFGRVYGLTKPEVRDRAPVIFDRLGLEWERALEPMSHLSRGQQQKVAVARSFLTAPNLMLLDEPTTGLDPRSKADVQTFVRAARAEHDTTILLTTHDMVEAELLCDRIVFLAAGRIVAGGSPLELRKQVAGDRPIDEISMETVFMELTGRAIDEDEDSGE